MEGGGPRPTVTVVIPVRDDHLLLERCLEALHRQTRRADEIIVVDNEDAEHPARSALTHQMTRWWGVGYRRETRPGIAAAAARGYDHARGDVIARLDADSEPPADWVERIADAFTADPLLEAITGPGDFTALPLPLQRLARVAYMDAYFLMFGAVAGHCPLFGSNFAMRRALWRSVRWLIHRWDAGVHDDLDLTLVVPRCTRIRLDPLLRVAVSVRAIAGPRPLGREARRGIHTLFVNRSRWIPGRSTA